jgi:hypothetical protein
MENGGWLLVVGYFFRPHLNPPRGGGLEGLDGFAVRDQRNYFPFSFNK